MSEKPKRFKHLRVLARRIFGQIALDCDYTLFHRDEQIPLRDPEMPLIQYFNTSTPTEIHLKPLNTENEQLYISEIGNSDWQIVNGSNLEISDQIL